MKRARTLHQQGRLPLAAAAYREVLAAHPKHWEALVALGVLAGQQGHFPEALDYLDRAIALDPRHPMPHCNRGLALQELKRFDEAVSSYDRAIALKADYGVAHFNRGVAFKALGRREAALEDYARAIAINPGFAPAHYNRAVLLQELGQWQAALTEYENTIALQPDRADAFNNRGLVLRALGRAEEAVSSYDRALGIEPRNAQVYLNRGVALQSLGRMTEALDGFAMAIELKPDFSDAYANRGLLLWQLQRWDEAARNYDRALEIDPDCADAYCGRGLLHASLGRDAAAAADYDRAIALEPHFAQAHFNRALLALAVGDFANGWVGHEWRWRAERTSSFRERRHFDTPLWLGDFSIEGKTILLHAEQGLGDTLHFCRYASLVAALGATVLLEVQKPLAGLLAGLAGVGRILVRGDALPEHDAHCPLMSLPLAFETRLDSIPAPGRYIAADASRIAAVAARLGPKTRPRVGLAWSGSATHANDANRSLPLAQIIPHLPDGIDYYCLQRDLRAVDRESLNAGRAITVLTDVVGNFDDTAALCECLDLVVSVDTSLAHLGGALGRPTWILLSVMADWRWLRERGDSPWYPTATLFRQRIPGAWQPVLERVGAALGHEFAAR